MPSFFSKFKKSKDKSSLHADLVKATAPESRFEACRILKAAGISSKVWLDDATQHFGVPVMLQSMFIVVPNRDTASAKLCDVGYVSAKDHMMARSYEVKLDTDYFYAPPAPTSKKLKQLHELLADPTHPAVGLLSAEEYGYKFPPDAIEDPSPFPTLDEYVTASITRYLHAKEEDFATRVMCTSYFQSIYLFGHVEAVKEPAFELKLPEVYRGFHRDMVAGTNIMGLMYYEFQKEYLEKIGGLDQVDNPDKS